MEPVISFHVGGWSRVRYLHTAVQIPLLLLLQYSGCSFIFHWSSYLYMCETKNFFSFQRKLRFLFCVKFQIHASLGFLGPFKSPINL